MSYLFFSSRRRHTRCALATGVETCALQIYSGRVNPEGLGSATHLHARPLEVEVGIDPHREVRGEAEMIRDRERASGLARRFKIERRAGGDRCFEFAVALAGAGETDVGGGHAACERRLEFAARDRKSVV